MRLKWILVSFYLEIVLILTEDRCTVCAKTYHRLRNRFGHTRWHSLVTRLYYKLDSVHLETVLVSAQDRCMVCAKRTIGSENILDTPMMVLQGDGAQV
jgi:hypothetical protein